jgi:uracil-DNA glycosylase family 4
MLSKSDQLEAIAKRIRSRELDLEIAKTCLNPVPGEGSPEADIMLVGEAPGAQEDKQGRPFIGASGKFLGEMLGSIGLSREQVFITNIVKFRPPENRDPSKQEIEACLPYLIEQIQVIEPHLVVFLGRHSMNVFFPDLRIGEAHGVAIKDTVQVGELELKDQQFLPLYHPAAALYNGSMRATLLEDFARIPEIIKQTSL